MSATSGRINWALYATIRKNDSDIKYHSSGCQKALESALKVDKQWYSTITPWSRLMTSNMYAARAALKEIKRCAAYARSTGLPCQKPGTGAGGRCRHHGGLSTGRPIIHGRDTAVAKLNRESARLLVAVIHKLQGGKSSGFFKLGRLTREQVIKVLERLGIAPLSDL